MLSTTIYLSKAELEWCLEYAEKIVEHYGKRGNNGSGSYNHNKVDSNYLIYQMFVDDKYLKDLI